MQQDIAPAPTPTAVIKATSPVEPTAAVKKPKKPKKKKQKPADPQGTPITVKVSHYDPNLGGVNCYYYANGECASEMSNGERWQEYFGENNTIACPMEVPFGSVIVLDGVEYTCRDRGGAIVITWEGYYWIDILAESVPYYYGELREAILVDK